MKFTSFAEFYPFYLSEHMNPTCRMLHFVGTLLVLVLIALASYLGHYELLWFLPVAGYGFAWVGHFGFEKNKPAAFKNPIYSLMGDFLMFWQILTRKIPLRPV
jgi:hypothetical protein